MAGKQHGQGIFQDKYNNQVKGNWQNGVRQLEGDCTAKAIKGNDHNDHNDHHKINHINYEDWE